MKRVALAALALLVAAACNTLTSAAEYRDVSTCTGPLCKQRCEFEMGGTFDDASGTCMCECDGKGCPPSGLVPMCGTHCCNDIHGLLACTELASGERVCGAACNDGDAQCGPSCCTPPATCINDAVGACQAAYGKPGQSCGGGLVCVVPRLDGTTENADCCESVAVPGGTFAMGASNGCAGTPCNADELPQHQVTLSPFRMDRFEVTVGRFRNFVAGWDYRPIPADAATSPFAGQTGWQAGWNARLPTSREGLEASLACDPATQTWTAAPAANEALPINCVTWYLAFAFCAWDGGRLPIEAEWELAASNASSETYPWGNDMPTPARAVYDCAKDAMPCTPPARPAPIGSSPTGADRWGVRDLAGNVSEWTLDTYAPYPAAAAIETMVVQLGGVDTLHVVRGGSFRDGFGAIRAAAREPELASSRSATRGFRCVRLP